MVLSSSLQRYLLNYSWPGNVRELEYAIHRAVVLTRISIDTGDIILQPQYFIFDNNEYEFTETSKKVIPLTKNLREAMDDFQRKVITQVLEQNHHNWSAYARELSLDIANLHRLAKRLGLE